jgi:hypothetical protein
MYELLQETVANNMTRSVRSVAPEMTVYRLLGIIAREDVMRALARCTMRQAPPLNPCETARCLRLV